MFLKIFGLFFIFAWIAKEFIAMSFKSGGKNTGSKRSNNSNEE